MAEPLAYPIPMYFTQFGRDISTPELRTTYIERHIVAAPVRAVGDIGLFARGALRRKHRINLMVSGGRHILSGTVARHKSLIDAGEFIELRAFTKRVRRDETRHR